MFRLLRVISAFALSSSLLSGAALAENIKGTGQAIDGATLWITPDDGAGPPQRIKLWGLQAPPREDWRAYVTSRKELQSRIGKNDLLDCDIKGRDSDGIAYGICLLRFRDNTRMGDPLNLLALDWGTAFLNIEQFLADQGSIPRDYLSREDRGDHNGIWED